MKNDTNTNYINDLVEKMSINKHSYIVSRKKKLGYFLVDNPSTVFEDCNITNYLKFNDQYNKIIKEFSDILNKEFKKEYSNTFNKNIKTVKIIDNKLKIFNKITDFIFQINTNASYSPYNNQINVLTDSIKDSDNIKRIIMHELLHMSTTKEKKFCGLSQDVKTKYGTKIVGNAVNEGMTEYLNQKYFSKEASFSYNKQITLIKAIERVVGEDVLLSCYFDKGLPKLINELDKYSKDNSIGIDIILNMDDMLNNKSGILNNKKEKAIRKDIASLYQNKIDKEVTLGKIDEDEYQKLKFLHVDRFIKGDIVYSDEAEVIETDKSYHIIDGFYTKDIEKKSSDIIFKPIRYDNDHKSL